MAKQYRSSKTGCSLHHWTLQQLRLEFCPECEEQLLLIGRGCSVGKLMIVSKGDNISIKYGK